MAAASALATGPTPNRWLWRDGLVGAFCNGRPVPTVTCMARATSRVGPQHVTAGLNGAHRDSVERAYATHAPAVRAAAQRVLGDPDRAQDAAHDVFVRFCRNPSGFDPARGDLKHYLQLMARSRALDMWRSDQAGGRARERLEAVVEPGRPQVVESPAVVAEHHSERRELLGALGKLPAPQREAVFLAYWGDQSMADIARRSGVPLATVKSRVRLGLKRLALDCAGPTPVS